MKPRLVDVRNQTTQGSGAYQNHTKECRSVGKALKRTTHHKKQDLWLAMVARKTQTDTCRKKIPNNLQILRVPNYVFPNV